MDTSSYLRMVKAKGAGEKQKSRNMLKVQMKNLQNLCTKWQEWGMRRGFARSSGTGAHGLGTRCWGIRACSAGSRAVSGGVQLLPYRRWQQSFPRCFDKMENERTRGKGSKCQERVVPKQVKEIFSGSGLSNIWARCRENFWSLNYLVQNPTGHSPKQPIMKNFLFWAGNWSWPQGQWKLFSDSGFCRGTIS